MQDLTTNLITNYINLKRYTNLTRYSSTTSLARRTLLQLYTVRPQGTRLSLRSQGKGNAPGLPMILLICCPEFGGSQYLSSRHINYFRHDLSTQIKIESRPEILPRLNTPLGRTPVEFLGETWGPKSRQNTISQSRHNIGGS